MPAYAVDLLARELGALDGRAILILGVAYRGGVKEAAFSGAAALRDELRVRGARPLASDPLYSDAELEAAGYEPWGGADVAGAIVQADHEQYRALRPGPADDMRQQLLRRVRSLPDRGIRRIALMSSPCVWWR